MKFLPRPFPLVVIVALCLPAQALQDKPLASNSLGTSTDPSARSGTRRVEGSIVVVGGTAMVKVVLATPGLTYHQSIYTDSGRFSFGGVPAGSYDITLSADGYQTIHETVDVASRQVGAISLQYILYRQITVKKSAGGGVVSAAELKVPEAARKHYDAGVKELQLHHGSAARAQFQKAVARYPAYPYALQQLARFDTLEGRPEVALARLQLAVKTDPTFAEGFAALAYVLDMLERDPECAAAAERAISLNPNLWRPYFELSRALLALGDVPKAEEVINRLAALDPALPETHLLRAVVLLKRRQSELAKAELNAFLSAAPQHPYAALARNTLLEIERKN